MQGFEVEDQVEFAYIFEEAIERLDKDLDEVEEGERRFGGCADDDEVESCVVSVGNERWRVVVRGGWRRRLGGAGEQRWEAAECLVDSQGRSNGPAYGRKLHAEFGRLATSVKISEMRRC